MTPAPSTSAGQRERKGKVPAVLSAPRIRTLLASLLVALCSGTNYVYSAYAPQLGERLHITHTQLNIVAVAGNVGVYVTGPILGRLVDTRGPRILILSASILLFLGYGGIKLIYDTGLPADSSPETTLPFGRFLLLVLCSFLTGAGGDAGLMSAVNTTARPFLNMLPCVLCWEYDCVPWYTHIGTSLPMILGFFFVRPIPLPEPTSPDIDDEGEKRRRRCWIMIVWLPTCACRDNADDLENLDEEGIEMAPLGSSKKGVVGGVSITRGKLWRTGDFWLLFGILSLVSGTGLMYINNIGSMCQALLAHVNEAYTTLELTSWQATQVSAISRSFWILTFVLPAPSSLLLALPPNHLLALRSFFFLYCAVPSPGTRILFSLPPLRSTFTLLCAFSLSFTHTRTSIPLYSLHLPTYLLSSSYHFPPRTFTSSLLVPPSSSYTFLLTTSSLSCLPSTHTLLPLRATFHSHLPSTLLLYVLYSSIPLGTRFPLLAPTPPHYLLSFSSLLAFTSFPSSSLTFFFFLFPSSFLTILTNTHTGLLSDTLTAHLHLPRSSLFTLTSLLLLASQLAAYSVGSIDKLWIVSVPLGFAYGSVFSLAPVVCMEWFGVEHLSENWGYLAISPMFSGNIFSLVFGRNLDAHAGVITHPAPLSSPVPPSPPTLPTPPTPPALPSPPVPPVPPSISRGLPNLNLNPRSILHFILGELTRSAWMERSVIEMRWGLLLWRALLLWA
ncbi:hypothetical protein BDQ17DRAFT_1431105 [Cyathus striatus]|nr:hypothetical protein BDQ17DRAFT_1431105 [Cyathus striatus]